MGGTILKHKKAPIFIVVLCLPAAVYFIYCFVMTIYCEANLPPSYLSPEEIIYKLEAYWNSGNEKGISMLCSENFNIASSERSYSFYEDVVRTNVEITECEKMSETVIASLGYPQLYDKHCYKVCWNCTNDAECDWRSGGFAFFLIAKENADENTPYKICAMFTGL